MKIRNLRWWIVGLLVVVSVKNYVDRQMLPILAPTIQNELHMSDRQYGEVTNLFLVAYTVAFLLSGPLVDALGSRLSLTLFIFVWSAAGALTGFARSVAPVGWLRFAFGLGEAGGYTASAKVVSEWFPPAERGVASSLYAIGGSLGATVAPIITVVLATHYGWRPTFIIAGVLGVAMIVPCLMLCHNPRQHAWMTPQEHDLIQAGQQAERQKDKMPGLTQAGRLKTILASPTVWALMAARMLTDPVWYFFTFWMPKYLHTARGFSQGELVNMWLIFLAADVGFLGGGYLSDRLVRRGQDARAARLRVMFGSALMVPAAAAVAAMPNSVGVFAISMIVILAHGAWLTNLLALIMDLVPKPIFGTAFGLIAAGSALGGIIMNQAVASTISRFSYDYCFYAMIVLHPLAFALLWLFARRPQRTDTGPQEKNAINLT